MVPTSPLITDQHIIILDVEKLRSYGMSVQEFVSMAQLGIYPNLDIYQIKPKATAIQELIAYST